ncbi:MAG: TIM barrel protein [Acidimicrobiales bacterium]|nr:TIM barrel protein [Acidimicrobiales bacterium]
MKQSFAWWSFLMGTPDPDEQLEVLKAAAEMGYAGVEMAPEELWPAVADAGLAMVTMIGHEIERGFNDPALHPELTTAVAAAIDTAAAGGVPFVIVFSGNTVDPAAPDDELAIANCVAGLTPLAAQAGAAGVTLLLELLNSKVDHPGYQCDRSWWGFEVVRRVGSPGLKVLFDAYHMQMMEGDLTRTIKANLDLIGHIHTAGAPGRRDLDDRQEVNWRSIAGLLTHLGYDGWVGHEFMPRAEPIPALRAAYEVFA